MEETSRSEKCLNFLKRLKSKGKAYPDFNASIQILEEEANTVGLNYDTMELLITVLIKTELNSRFGIALIKCMIPRNKVSDADINKLVSWFLSLSAPVTILSTLLQWFIGCWEYQLVSRNSFYIYYDCFFYTMLKEERLESRLAQFLYLITKPEDVTRRQVDRLLKLNLRFRRPKKHITALLSLFKSYKPEVVPEKIQAINIQSVWRPILEPLKKGFEDARGRVILIQTKEKEELSGWNVLKMPKRKKNEEPLVPSIGYFDIGSNLFKNKIEKSIFDVSDMSSLAKYHSVVKLPCFSTSLLTNTIGYHLLTYADLEYQQRFMCNLYYTLWKAFIFESGRYTDDEMNQVLDMTSEFSRYMQHGVSIVSYFINDYLSFYVDGHQMQLLTLMQWSTISLSELQDYVLKHLKSMFYVSSLQVKCKIIRTLRVLISNLSVIGDDSFKDKQFPFLNQSFNCDLNKCVKAIENLTRELITAGLNIHDYDTILLSEALTFYEQYNIVQINKKTSFMPLAPSSVIYGCFVNRSCVLLSRVCALLLQYRKYFKDHKDQSFVKSIKRLITYAEDFVSGLWYDNCFSNRLAKNRKFLKNLSEELVKDYSTCNIDSSLNILQHYAVLPYMYTLNSSGLQIRTKKEANSVAAHYYIPVHQLLTALLGN